MAITEETFEKAREAAKGNKIGLSREEFQQRYNPPEEFMNKYFPAQPDGNFIEGAAQGAGQGIMPREPDRFGFDIVEIDDMTRTNKRLAADHLFVWNRLVENTGPIRTKMDELNPDRRLATLVGDESFRAFLNAKTMQEKMTVLRDVGMHRSSNMNDEELSKYLMTHVPSGLTEDPAVSKDVKEIQESQEAIPNKNNPFSEYYNYPKAWGKEHAPEERYYSDPEEKGIPPWLKGKRVNDPSTW